MLRRSSVAAIRLDFGSAPSVACGREALPARRGSPALPYREDCKTGLRLLRGCPPQEDKPRSLGSFTPQTVRTDRAVCMVAVQSAGTACANFVAGRVLPARRGR